jgi:hypothetical protein
MPPIIIFYVSKYLVDGLKILAGPAHWSQSSLHGSGFDPFICEKFSRARHSALTVEIAELRLDRANSRGFFPSTCRGHRGLAQRHSASMSGWERPGSGVCARASSSRMILTSPFAAAPVAVLQGFMVISASCDRWRLRLRGRSDASRAAGGNTSGNLETAGA